LHHMPSLASGDNLQRVGFLAYLPSLLRKFGVEPNGVLASAGLAQNALDSPENTIPYKAMGLLAEIAAERTGCAHFGLEIGKLIGISSLGAIGELMRNAPTIGTALTDFATHHHRNSHGGVVYLFVHDSEAFLGYAVYEPGVVGHNVICDGAALAACNFIKELAGKENAELLQVMLSRPTPPHLEPYQEAFKIRMQFDSAHTAVVMPRRLLDHAVYGADKTLRTQLEMELESVFHSGEADILTRLRRILRVGLLRGKHSVADVSAQMGMSSRTLQRRLNESGVGFQEALDSTRFEFAQQLLANTRLSVGEIAGVIGYADPSNLTRQFVHWSGKAPNEWRINRTTRSANREYGISERWLN